MWRKRLLTAVVAAGLTAQANAFIFTNLTDTQGFAQVGNPPGDVWKVNVNNADVGQSFTVDWLVPAGTVGSLPVPLKATSTWTVASLAGGRNSSLVLDVKIDNTTVLPSSGSNADILSFGFGVDPNSTATLTQPGTVFDSLENQTNQQTFPGGYKQIDICVFVQGCSGGSVTDALHAGSSDQVRLTLTPSTGRYDTTAGVDLLFFPLKFQTAWGSFEPAGSATSSGGSSNGGGPGGVPEPSGLALIGLGLAALGVAKRQRRASS